MRIIKASTPSADGFRMPGEFEPHQGCIMIFPDSVRQRGPVRQCQGVDAGAYPGG